MKRYVNASRMPHREVGYKPVMDMRHKRERLIEKHVFLRREMLLYQVDAETSVIMRARRDPNTHVDDHSLGTDEADKYRPLLNIYINQKVDEVKSALSAYILQEPRVASMNDIGEWEEIDMILMMPDYWQEDMYPMLVGAIQKYVTDATMYDYLSLRLSPSDPVTQGKLDAKDLAMAYIKKYSNTPKAGMVRKKLQPF